MSKKGHVLGHETRSGGQIARVGLPYFKVGLDPTLAGLLAGNESSSLVVLFSTDPKHIVLEVARDTH
jgi:hypothetical protein